ncbi:NAD(P)-dependent oxidoreductase [uncultured Methanobrevibacter sp.]|uniref:NAD-dependent epimerase/dehydratase family protein n=1 Tax=uncultured Methanobrevibacter sp. TaxID=253161 RepID=UPI0025DF792A|nr:NAD-dependent epimerase/dehydratase family protein [uncultured Methanobrevibacter sp.]
MILNYIIDGDAEQIIQENDGLKELFNTTIMITGASGMVGSYFLYTLVKLNEDYSANIKILPLVRNIDKLNLDIVNKDYVFPIIQDVIDDITYEGDVDYVIHAAGPASPKIMREKPVETNFANTLGSANTLMFSKDHNAKGYLFISSREIYGDPNENQKYFTEEGRLGFIDPLVPRNGYAEGKKAAENMCAGFKSEYGLNTKIVRLAHTYGPGMSVDDGRVQADFLKNVLNDEDIVLKSDGSSVRTYTYISDAVSAMFTVLLKSKDIVYNIADERNEVSIKELAETMVQIYPEKGLKLVFDIEDDENAGYAPFKFGILSTKKIKNELNWSAKYSVKEGFKRTLEFLQIE